MRFPRRQLCCALLLAVHSGCGDGSDAEADDTSTARSSAHAASVQTDTVLGDTLGIIVRAGEAAEGFRLSVAVRDTAGNERRVEESLTFPALPNVAIAEDPTGRFVLLSIPGPDLVGGVLLAVADPQARVLYNKWSPEGRVCAAPTLQVENGAVLLIEETAGAFPVEYCTDTFHDCVWQFPSTWPVVWRIDRGRLEEDVSRHTGFYAQRAALYRRWAERIEDGEKVTGQQQTTAETILSRCGQAVVDSLRGMAARADSIVNRP